MMASSINVENNDNVYNSLGIKVAGGLGDLHVVDNSDSEANDDDLSICESTSSQAIETLSNTVPGLTSASAPALPNNIFISGSENIQVGDSHHFHGPVTIKQVFKNRGIDNASYTKTDNEDQQSTVITKPSKFEDSAPKTIKVPPWLKVTLSVTSLGILGIIFALAFIIQNQNQDDKPHADGDTDKESTDPLLIAPSHLRIVSRSDWLAQPVEDELDKIRQPVPWVVITHTATEGCYYQSECVLRVRLIQMFHIESKQWSDIGYNFLVAGDGSAYFGRGWDYIGAHTLGYNRYSIGIAFVGTFNSETPPQKQIEACQKLIKLGVQLGKISKDYKLFAHRQLASTLSPGDKLYDIIKEWPHFVKEGTNLTDLIPKDY